MMRYQLEVIRAIVEVRWWDKGGDCCVGCYDGNDEIVLMVAVMAITLETIGVMGNWGAKWIEIKISEGKRKCDLRKKLYKAGTSLSPEVGMSGRPKELLGPTQSLIANNVEI
ncbi:unnamed protein product [Ilex paraguariensis]|uniref:Uncharacterized protein n=1 Tax=Ilex paraguariensis TaxID=185542 RepID=A0ABC8QKT4_9AQUA